MEVQKVFDSDGTWWTNTAKFAFVDPTTGCRFEPRVPTQAKQTEWMQTQEVIQPYVSTAPAEAPVKAAKSPPVTTTKAASKA